MAKTPTTTATSLSPNNIGKGTDVKGDISSAEDILINGSLTGNLSTKGKLVIGESGFVKGEITCKNAMVSGKIEGKISVGELLSLKASSNLKGDIVTQKLQIEPGAKFTGTCNMGSSNVTNDVSGSKEEKKFK